MKIMNEDLRVKLPLWTIGSILLLMIFYYYGVKMIDILLYNSEEFFYAEGPSISIHFWHPVLIKFYISMLFFILYLGIFIIRLRKHNLANPKKKIYFFSFFRPSELLEDDEMLSHVSKSAMKKVYILYTNALPVLILLMLLPLHRFVYLFTIFIILIAHYALFYWEIRSFYKGNYQSEVPKNKINMWNKYAVRGLIAITIVIVIIGVSRIALIQVNSNDIISKMEHCMDQGGTAMVEGGSFWSLSKFSCKK
ncbi:hypothetical protein [Sutcliffiella rhizosphaerae]|uniref:Uncharacterized protein n=1 Tax=Sutcliffiella rhizosphaerae TaxID=2880967 RepID=A0ABN8A8V3_9BACI|nr:hypothetical protein [Sutcliffiella rhizosphaerae]CAG9621586.1 hypothetical protein BACCIP111883_02359 [Sutcliffiella rhizosphaerae]